MTNFLRYLMILLAVLTTVMAAGCATTVAEVATAGGVAAEAAAPTLGAISFAPTSGRVGYPFSAVAFAEYYDDWSIAGTPAVVSGTLPPGVTFTGTGFEGTPLTAGEWPLTVRFTGITADAGTATCPDQDVRVTLVFAGPPAGPAFPAFQERVRAWRAMEIKPPFPEEARRHKVLAENAVREQNLEKAASEFLAALRIDPFWAPGYLQTARACGELKRYEDALNAMRCYQEFGPTDTDAEVCRNLIYIWEDKLAELNRAQGSGNQQAAAGSAAAGQQNTPQAKFARLLLEFEKCLKWEACDEIWPPARNNWVQQVQGATTVGELGQLLRGLEMHMKWEAMEDSWRGQREGWVARVDAATTYQQLASALIACEQMTKFTVQIPEWRARRESWIAEARGISIGPIRLRKG